MLKILEFKTVEEAHEYREQHQVRYHYKILPLERNNTYILFYDTEKEGDELE